MNRKTKLIVLSITIIIVVVLILWEPMIAALVVMFGAAKLIWDKIKNKSIGKIRKK